MPEAVWSTVVRGSFVIQQLVSRTFIRKTAVYFLMFVCLWSIQNGLWTQISSDFNFSTVERLADTDIYLVYTHDYGWATIVEWICGQIYLALLLLLKRHSVWKSSSINPIKDCSWYCKLVTEIVCFYSRIKDCSWYRKKSKMNNKSTKKFEKRKKT